jgi:hypothetical protein
MLSHFTPLRENREEENENENDKKTKRILVGRKMIDIFPTLWEYMGVYFSLSHFLTLSNPTQWQYPVVWLRHWALAWE